MKSLKKALVVLLAIMFNACYFSACENKYNATMYDKTEEWMLKSFLDENLIYGAHFGDAPDDYYKDESYPKERTFIIKSQEEFNEIFKEFTTEIDFEKEMLLIYGIAIGSSNAVKIKKIKLNDNALKIEYKITKPNKIPPGGSTPIARWIALKIDKLDITTVAFVC